MSYKNPTTLFEAWRNLEDAVGRALRSVKGTADVAWLKEIDEAYRVLKEVRRAHAMPRSKPRRRNE